MTTGYPPGSETPDDRPALEAAYRHVATAHYRLATAEGIDPELAASCLADLHAAMERLKETLPPSRPRRGQGLVEQR